MADTSKTKCFTFREACAEQLGISMPTGYSLANSGQIKTFTIGRTRYITEAELQRFIRKRLAAAPAERPARSEKARQTVAARIRKHSLEHAAEPQSA